jgi:hypothetical protein
MSEPTLKLQAGAEELLRDFAMTEPDFETQANAITAKFGSKPAEGAPSDDDLFRTPALSPESGEPSLPVPPSAVRAARVAEKSNFAEMARKSLQRGQDDSTALAKELLAATAQSRRPNAELVERVKAAGRASATATPLPTNEAERTSGVVTRVEAAAAAPATAARASVAAPSPASSGVNRGTVIGIFGTVVALAACFALYVKSNEPKASPTSVALQAERDSETPATAGKAAPAAVAAAEPAKPSEAVVSPEALAASEPKAAAAGEKPSVAKAGAAAAPVALGAKAAPAPSSGPKQEVVELAEDPTPQQAPVAPKQAAEPAPEPQLKPAEGNSGSVPISPSAGAVSTALGSVRSGASACLAGQTESVSASVTFGSDGHVLSVRASGPAAACIQAALSKAHVAPFAKESFTASTTVRPP